MKKKKKIANIIMIGDEEKIMDGAGWLEIDLSNVEVIDPETTDRLDDYIELLYETRKEKGMTPEKALDWIEEKMIPYYPLGVFKDRDKEAVQ